MSTEENNQAEETAKEKKARILQEKADAKAEKAEKAQEAKAAKLKAKEEKAAAKAAAKAEAKANKPPGVIASILEFVENSEEPITQDGVIELLSERFPDRDKAAMTKTVKAQLGGKAQPTRMEKEKGVEFEIKFVQVEEVTKGKDGAEDTTAMVDSKEKTYLYKGKTETES